MRKTRLPVNLNDATWMMTDSVSTTNTPPMIASTISGGDPNSGVMGPTNYIKWRKINKKIALIAPAEAPVMIGNRSSGR